MTLSRVLPLLLFVAAIGAVMLGLSLFLLNGNEAAMGVSIAGAVALAAAVIAMEILRHRDIRRIARRVDYRLGSAELLSTALGAQPEAGASPVGRSLLRRAEAYANALDMDRAAPVFSRAIVFAAAALIVAVGGIWVGSIVSGRPVSVEEAPVIETAETQAPVAADDIETLARLLAEDAERRDSDYLEAVSKSLEELAAAARQGKPEAEIQTELQTLIDHAQRGYEGQLPRWMADTPGDAGALLQSARAFDEARQAAALAREQAAQNGDRPVAGGRSSDMYNLPEDRMTRSANATPSGNAVPEDGGAMAASEGELTGADQAGGGFAARPMEDATLEGAGAFPIGAAAQSGKGESNMAGGGAQPLEPDSQYLASMPDPTQNMTISAAETQPGNRIRLHVPTEAEAAERSAAEIDAEDIWARQSAQIIERQPVAPEAGAVVSRYFNRPTESRGAGQ